jgi:plastocyanin
MGIKDGIASMSNRILRISLLILLSGISLRAADVEGTIVVQHKLTKSRVTPTASMYERGVSIRLGSDQENDPLAYERTHVVIYLEGDSAKDEVVGELGQKDRRFSPDLVVVPMGSTVSFPNYDPIFHDVFSLSNAKSFDLGNYAQARSRSVTFPKPGIIFVNCHLHSNMSAVIVVTPNRWSTKADAGHFTLPNVPPGKYTIVAWHKAAGFFRKTIQVTQTGSSYVEFAIPLDEEGHVQQASR